MKKLSFMLILASCFVVLIAAKVDDRADYKVAEKSQNSFSSNFFAPEEGAECEVDCDESIQGCSISCIYTSVCVEVETEWVKCDGNKTYCSVECNPES